MATTPPSPPPLVIRKATPDDIPLLLPLIQSAYRGEASRKGWTTEADLVAGQRIDAAGLLLKIDAALGAVLIAFLPGEARPVACCEVVVSSSSQQDVAYFGLFAVDPARQAGGLGRAVLARAEDYAKGTWGVAAMEMTVIWTRAELMAWYARRGYVNTRERRPFPYGDLSNGAPLRDDLYFEVLRKELL